MLLQLRYTQNAAIFSRRMAVIRKALHPTAECVFVDAPHVVDQPTPTSNTAFDSDAQPASTNSEDTPRAWWFRKDIETAEGKKLHYKGLADSMDHIARVLKEQGPFDGVWGFSQVCSLVRIPILHLYLLILFPR